MIVQVFIAVQILLLFDKLLYLVHVDSGGFLGKQFPFEEVNLLLLEAETKLNEYLSLELAHQFIAGLLLVLVEHFLVIAHFERVEVILLEYFFVEQVVVVLDLAVVQGLALRQEDIFSSSLISGVAGHLW